MFQDIDKVTVSVEDVTEENLILDTEESFTVILEEEDELLLTMSDEDEMLITMTELVVCKGEDIVKQMIVGTEPIDAFKAVYQAADGKIYLYSVDDIDLVGKFVGITLESGNPGEVVTVKLTGEISNSQWDFGTETSVVYAGVDGNLSTVESQSAMFSHELGVSFSPTTLIIEPKLATVNTEEIQNSVLVHAGATINGHRVVRTDEWGNAYMASSTDQSQAYSILGVSLQVIIGGENGYVLKDGVMEEPTWSWTPMKPLYFDDIGRLTHTAPVAGFVCSIGYAITETKILVRITQPILL